MADTELPAYTPRAGDENYRSTDNLLSYSDVVYEVYDLVSRDDDSESEKNYRDGTSSETCATKLDNDEDNCVCQRHHAETCISSGCKCTRGSRNESREETRAKSDYASSGKDRDESRCSGGSNRRRRRTRGRTPKGIIIDLSNDTHGTKHNGIQISVISVHNLASDTRFDIAIPKRNSASKRGLAIKQRTRSRSSTHSQRREADKVVSGPMLAVFYAKNRGENEKTGRWTKRESRSRQRGGRYETTESTSKMPRPNVDAIAHTADQSRNLALNEPELSTTDNPRPVHASDSTLGSMKCCHRDTARFEADNARCSSGGEAYASEHVAEAHCCSFNDGYSEYHVCEREGYNTDTSDFNPEPQVHWMPIGCIHHDACVHECRCFCHCHSSANVRLDRNPNPTRATGLLRNSSVPERIQREEVERFGGSNEPRAASATEFASGEYSYGTAEGERYASRHEAETARSSASTIRKCTPSRASVFVEAGGSVDDLRDSGGADDLQCEIHANPEHSVSGNVDEWPRKSSRGDLVGTRTTMTGDYIERHRSPGRSPGEQDEFGREVVSKWPQGDGAIKTDTQQSDYEWKRKIVDGDTSASVDFKRKRDSRYTSEVAIHVQLCEKAEIRKPESLQMVEATSQTKEDNTSATGKRRDYSLWPSLQIGKIWSQVHDAYKKLTATGTGRVAKDAYKYQDASERSRRLNPDVETVRFASSSSSRTDGMCGETCHGNLTRSKTSGKSEAREEEERDDDVAESYAVEVSTWEKPRASSSGRDATRKGRNPEKMENGESAVFYDEHAYCEHDEYPNEFAKPLPQNETYGQTEAAYPQSRSRGSFAYLEVPVYPQEFRSRGGSDDTRDFARSIGDRWQDTVQLPNEETTPDHHQNSMMAVCAYHKTSHLCMHCAKQNEEPVHKVDSYDSNASSASIGASDVPHTPSNREFQSTNPPAIFVSQPKTSGQILAEYPAAVVETVRNPTLRIIAENEMTVTKSPMKIDTMIYSPRKNSDEATPSTSTWGLTSSSEPQSATSKRKSRAWPRWLTMKFLKRKHLTNARNKVIAPFKRRSKKPELATTTTSTTGNDDETNITQIETPIVPTAAEDNVERQTDVNVRVQTLGTTAAKILSELVGNEKAKGMLMTITLQSTSTDDVPDRRNAET